MNIQIIKQNMTTTKYLVLALTPAIL